MHLMFYVDDMTVHGVGLEYMLIQCIGMECYVNPSECVLRVWLIRVFER